ncbi:C-C motif chemokine 4-like [Brachionichthys hirsutus]|uniref:C-C motif chemokine 4-like n=1 Tax=Brachionichthys hirsutus TaxID=412623 RepID=UPI003604BE09
MKMRFILVLATLLCFIRWMAHASSRPAVNCCVGMSTTKVKQRLIVNYTIQSEGVCTTRAVRFLTKRGKTLCSDPALQWVREAMLKVDKERDMKASQERVRNEEGMTSNSTTPAYTTAKKTLQRGGRKRWRQRKTLRGRKRLRGRIN